MLYSYTLLGDFVEDPPKFAEKGALRKHLLLSISDDAAREGIVIDAGQSSYYFANLEEVLQYLEIEDDKDGIV